MTLPARRGEGSQGRSTLRMKQADGGTVEVSNEAIENLLRDELEQLPEVRRVAPKVRLAGGAVETSLDAWIEPSASIAHATTVLGQGVAGVLRDQVGVTNVRRPDDQHPLRRGFGAARAGRAKPPGERADRFRFAANATHGYDATSDGAGPGARPRRGSPNE